MRNLVSAILVLSSPLLAQTTFWVDANTGNDTNPGTATQPLRSITRAVSLAGVNDRVWVRPGTYGPNATGEMLPISIGAVPQDGLELRSVGPNGSVIVDLAQSKSQMFRIDQSANGATISGFVFTNSDTTDWWTRVIDTSANASAVDIERCLFSGVNRGIVIWGSGNQITGMRIHHNVFDGCTNDAIDEFGSSSNNEIAHNTIVGSTQGPNYVGILTEATNTKIHDNVVVGMRDGFLTSMGAQAANFAGNDPWNNKTDWSGTVTAPPGNFSVDPQFVNLMQRDFRLQSSSPLIDVAAGPAIGDADLRGVPASVDGDGNGAAKPDVGAQERTPAQYDVTVAGGTTTFSLNGPPGVGFIVFSTDEGRVPLPGGSWALLDLAGLFPVVVTGGLPLSVSAPTPVGFPGARVVSQGLLLNTGSLTLDPSKVVWTLF